MAGNEKKINFAIGAKLSSNFKTSLGQAQGSFTDLAKMEAKFGAVQLKTAKDIEKMNASISKSPQELKKLNEGFKGTGIEIEKVRHKMDLTSKEMEHDKSPQLKKKYKDLEKELEKLGSSYVTQKNKIDTHVSKIEKEKKSVEELNKKYKETSQALEQVNKVKKKEEQTKKYKEIYGENFKKNGVTQSKNINLKEKKIEESKEISKDDNKITEIKSKYSLNGAQGAFNNLSKVESKFGALQIDIAKDIDILNKSIAQSPEELKKLNKEMLNTKSSMGKTQIELEEVSKLMKTDSSKELRKKYSDLNRELDGLNRTYNNQKERRNSYKRGIEEEKNSLNSLNKKYEENIKIIERSNKLERRKKTIKGLESTSKGINNAGNKAMGAGAVGAAVLAPLVYQAIDSESAFADVKKQFDFKDKKEEEAFKTKMQKLITEKNMAISLTDLYGSIASAGQRGVKLEDLEENIILTTKMGVAMDMDKQQAAEMGLGMKQAFGMTIPQLEQMLDQINYLTNTTGAAATPLIAYQNTVGSLGKIAGFTAGQTAAVGATLLDMNMEANVAATGVKKMMTTLAGADKATDKQVYAYRRLGLNYKTVGKSMQKDAEGTLVKVLEKISNLKKEEQVGIIKELFGDEAIVVVSNLVNGTENLKKNLDAMKNKKLFEGSMNKEYEERLKTTANAIENLKGRTQILATNLGGTLLPEVNKFIKYLGDLSGKLVKLQKQDPVKFEKYMKIFLYGTIGLIAFGTGLKVVSGTLNSFIIIMKAAGAVAETAIGKKTVGALKSLAKQEVSVRSMSGALGALGAIGAGWTIGTAIGELINDLIKLLGYDEQVQKFVDMLTFGDSDNAIINAYEKNATPQLREAIKRNPSLMGEKMQATYQKAGRKPFDREIIPTNDYGNIPQHARGGIFNDSHLGIFGEAGAEALIPINGSANSRNLWEATGRLIGASSNNNYSTENTKSSFSFNPVYNINGNVDENTISEVAKSTFRDFEKEFSKWEKERMRRR